MEQSETFGSLSSVSVTRQQSKTTSEDGKLIQSLIGRIHLLEEKVAVLEGKGTYTPSPTGNLKFSTRTFQEDAFAERDHLIANL